MVPDWSVANREDRVRVYMVSPGSLGEVVGELRGVDRSSCSVTEGYYTDTRVSGKVRTVGEDGYVEHAWLRIVHEVPSLGYAEEMLTGPVSAVEAEAGGGVTSREYAVESSLYAIKDDLMASGWTIGTNATLRSFCESVLGTCRRPHDLSAMCGRVFRSPVIYERGESALHMLLDACGDTDRVSVDGHGVITVSAYVPPSSREPSQDVDPASGRSVVIGPVRTSDSSETVPGRVVYVSGSGDRELSATADAPASWPSSSTQRGYMVARKESDSTSDVTWDQLRAKAEAALKAAQDPGRKHELTVAWQAWHQGDVVRLRAGGSWRKCLVQAVEDDMGSMTQRVTLKEV